MRMSRTRARIRVGQVRPLGIALGRHSLSGLSLNFVPRLVTCFTLVLALPNENRRKDNTYLSLVFEQISYVGIQSLGQL